MRSPRLCALFTTALLLFPVLPAFAHHSFTSEYDATTVEFTGTITRVDWFNPHVWFYMDIKGPDGKTANWAFSAGAPGQISRRGLTKNALKPGTVVRVDGFRAKNGSNNGYSSRITFPDGRSYITSGNDPEARKP